MVEACIRSVETQAEGLEVIVLSEKTIKDYVKLPWYIVEKYKMGHISAAHFSDIVRVSLLAKWGGIWMDATVLCTDASFLDYIHGLPLFVYQKMGFGKEFPIISSSWLIASEPHNPIVELTKELLYVYWKTYD